MRDRSQSSHCAGGIIQIFISEKVMGRRESLIKSNQRRIAFYIGPHLSLSLAQKGAFNGGATVLLIKPDKTEINCTAEIILTAKLHKFHIIFV